MRRTAVSVPPEAIWLGESWEEPPPRKRASGYRAAGPSRPTTPGRPATTPRPVPALSATSRSSSAPGVAARPRATEVRSAGASRGATAARGATASARATAPRSATAPVRATAPPRATGAPSAERRTVTITGRGADPTWLADRSRRRPARPAHERHGFKPDRAAMWAVLLGLLLVLVAATSSHAAVRAHAGAALRAPVRAVRAHAAPVAQAHFAQPRHARLA